MADKTLKRIADFSAGDHIECAAECDMNGVRLVVPENNSTHIATFGDGAIFMQNIDNNISFHYRGSLWGDCDKWRAVS